MSYLEMVNLSKSFREANRERMVLHNTNLKVEQGEFISILGKSGSGKTTLLNMISGIDTADGGSIFLNGTDLTHLNDTERTIFRRKNIGIIFQFFNLIPTLTVWENITLPLVLNRCFDKACAGRAEEFLREVELSDRKDTFPDRLSGGEQQRVAIARALVHDPLLVLADEPTGNLDEDTGAKILALLDRLTRKVGKNLILVTHSNEAALIADRTLVLRDGQLLDVAR